jgi:citrate lyase beta subunit
MRWFAFPSVILPTKVSSGADTYAGSLYHRRRDEKRHCPRNNQLMPLIETAIGVENAFEIAKASPDFARCTWERRIYPQACTAKRQRKAMRFFTAAAD